MINKNLMFDIAVYFYQNYGISMESIAVYQREGHPSLHPVLGAKQETQRVT